MVVMPGAELIGKEERDAVNAVFDRGCMLYRYGFDEAKGEISQVSAFEKSVAGYLDTKYAYAVSSGTAALKCALIGMGVRPGDEIITQSHTFVATVEAIIEVGAVPVIAEVNKTLNMDPSDFKKKITAKTRAVIPVHMAGVPAQMNEIGQIAKKHDLMILEDSAQALGATYFGKHAGAMGNAAILSFDYGKMITSGEGGMVLTNKKDIYQRAREYADHGHEMNPRFPRGKDTRTIAGFNFRMMELQGAIGVEQMKKIDYAIKCQRSNKKTIKEGILEAKGLEFREIPDPSGEICDTLIFFLKDSKKALKFAEGLQNREIYTKNLPDAIKWHFAGTWDHMLPAFSRYKNKDLMKIWPESAKHMERSVAIAINILMTEEEIDQRVKSINAIAKSL